MKMRKISVPVIIVCILVVINIGLHGQTSIKMPLEIAKAYQTGTRSSDGNPGPNYWQNYSDYNINASLLTEESKLVGNAAIVYHNNSNDSLKEIVIRLYPDFFKKGNARSWTIGNDDLTDGTFISNFKIAGKNIDLKNRNEVRRTATNLIVNLEKTINPGDSAHIEIDWEIMIPRKTWARMGNYGNDRFFVAYWYPQIAVYDDIDGWDKIEYYGTVEFYNDFNNYDVTITTPPQFTVWATGDLMNMDQIYKARVVEKYTKASSSDEIINIFSVVDCKNDKVLLSNKSNKWNFVAKNIPDFTFGMSKISNWDGTSIIADIKTGERVTIDVVYPDSVDSFDEGAYYSRESVRFMIDSLPGYPFPYSHITSFCNGRKRGGMESPMMVNEGDPADEGVAIGLIFHEILHSYFPFYMGTNERKYSWMDEGWATWLVYGIMDELKPDYNYFERISDDFGNLSGKEKEIPLIYLSYQISDYSSYRVHSYNRSSMAYAYLREALGDKMFKKALHAYMDRWNGKHPIPYDFFNTFEDVTRQDLDWYIQPWFFNRDYADMGIKKVTLDNKIVVENSGGLPLPVVITCLYTNGTQDEYYRNPSVWSNGDKAIIIQANSQMLIKSVTLGNNKIPDVIDTNNQIVISHE
jgi:peptidase M1-like protein